MEPAHRSCDRAVPAESAMAAVGSRVHRGWNWCECVRAAGGTGGQARPFSSAGGIVAMGGEATRGDGPPSSPAAAGTAVWSTSIWLEAVATARRDGWHMATPPTTPVLD